MFQFTAFSVWLLTAWVSLSVVPSCADGDAQPRPIRLIVRFEASVPKVRNANLIVRIEEVTVEDAPSRVVEQTILRGVSVGGSEESVVVNLKDLNIKHDSRYNVRLIIDVDRDEKRGPGDYVTNTRFMFDGGAIPKNARGEEEIVVKVAAEDLTKL